MNSLIDENVRQIAFALPSIDDDHDADIQHRMHPEKSLIL